MRSIPDGNSSSFSNYLSAKLAWTTLDILALTYLVAFMNRQILLQVDPINADLHISNTQVGLLTRLVALVIRADVNIT